jgi:hypothetical protein
MSSALDEFLERIIAFDRARSDGRVSRAIRRLSRWVSSRCRAGALMPENTRDKAR